MEVLNNFALLRINQLERVKRRQEHLEIILDIEDKRFTVVGLVDDDAEGDAKRTHTLRIDDRFLFGMHLIRRSILKDLEPFRVVEPEVGGD